MTWQLAALRRSLCAMQQLRSRVHWLQAVHQVAHAKQPASKFAVLRAGGPLAMGLGAVSFSAFSVAMDRFMGFH